MTGSEPTTDVGESAAAPSTDPATQVRLPLGSSEIMRVIPHRYPFLLIDRVIELDERRVVAIKQVTANEPHFQGHFPDRPIMPGVLIIEALAQAGAVSVLIRPENRGKLALFAGIEDCRFRRVVVPGDTLRLEVTMEKLGRSFGRGRAVASVDGEVAAEATIMFLIPRDQDIGGASSRA